MGLGFWDLGWIVSVLTVALVWQGLTMRQNAGSEGEVSLFGKPEHEDLKPRIANIPETQESSRLEYKIVARFEKPFTQMPKTITPLNSGRQQRAPQIKPVTLRCAL